MLACMCEFECMHPVSVRQVIERTAAEEVRERKINFDPCHFFPASSAKP